MLKVATQQSATSASVVTVRPTQPGKSPVTVTSLPAGVRMVVPAQATQGSVRLLSKIYEHKSRKDCRRLRVLCHWFFFLFFFVSPANRFKPSDERHGSFSCSGCCNTEDPTVLSRDSPQRPCRGHHPQNRRRSSRDNHRQSGLSSHGNRIITRPRLLEQLHLPHLKPVRCPPQVSNPATRMLKTAAAQVGTAAASSPTTTRPIITVHKSGAVTVAQQAQVVTTVVGGVTKTITLVKSPLSMASSGTLVRDQETAENPQSLLK